MPRNSKGGGSGYVAGLWHLIILNAIAKNHHGHLTQTQSVSKPGRRRPLRPQKARFCEVDHPLDQHIDLAFVGQAAG